MWVLATCNPPNSRVKDLEGVGLATIIQPNPRVQDSEGYPRVKD